MKTLMSSISKHLSHSVLSALIFGLTFPAPVFAQTQTIKKPNSVQIEHGISLNDFKGMMAKEHSEGMKFYASPKKERELSTEDLMAGGLTDLYSVSSETAQSGPLGFHTKITQAGTAKARYSFEVTDVNFKSFKIAASKSVMLGSDPEQNQNAIISAHESAMAIAWLPENHRFTSVQKINHILKTAFSKFIPNAEATSPHGSHTTLFVVAVIGAVGFILALRGSTPPVAKFLGTAVFGILCLTAIYAYFDIDWKEYNE